MGDIDYNDYNVIYLDLPGTVKGFVLKSDEFYTIVLNSRLNCIQNSMTLKHELNHILYGDFYKTEDINLIEKMRHA